MVEGLAERGEREPQDVGRVILDLETAPPEKVADGVDRPGGVLLQEDPYRPAPQQRTERPNERLLERQADQKRDREADQREPGKGPVQDSHAAILDQLARV